jgi:hypothetical protein
VEGQFGDGRRAATRRTGRARRQAAGARTGRRTVRWADWRLDERTRAVGRQGVAQARAALEQANRQAS